MQSFYFISLLVKSANIKDEKDLFHKKNSDHLSDYNAKWKQVLMIYSEYSKLYNWNIFESLVVTCMIIYMLLYVIVLLWRLRKKNSFFFLLFNLLCDYICCFFVYKLIFLTFHTRLYSKAIMTRIVLFIKRGFIFLIFVHIYRSLFNLNWKVRKYNKINNI